MSPRGRERLDGRGRRWYAESGGTRGICGPEGERSVRKVLIGLGAIVGALLVILLAYAAYVFLSMDRIEDDLPLDVKQNAVETVETGREYTLLTWNLGFAPIPTISAFSWTAANTPAPFPKRRWRKTSPPWLRACANWTPTSRFCRKWTWTPTAVGTSMSAPCCWKRSRRCQAASPSITIRPTSFTRSTSPLAAPCPASSR